jgi:hypothetical protein
MKLEHLHRIAFSALAVCGFFSLPTLSFAQSNETGPKGKPKWSVSWGWNWEGYSKSDIHFSGSDHNFTLKNVSAKDKQDALSLNTIVTKWLNPAKMTLPQTNTRVAYQLNADTAIALNLDHMKYVVSDGQTVNASGYYGSTTYAAGATQLLNPSFMHFEHTDGLNVVTLEYEKQYPLAGYQGARAFWLVGAGVVVPKSNVTMNMVGQTRTDKYHLAGYAVNGAVGLEKDFATDLFIRSTAKFGHVNMNDVVTSARGDKASHRFQFSEFSITAGYRF